jgi:Polyketide cyclase / dehydrase and lipid transport
MKGIKFTEKILIKANQAVVFDYTQDYNNRLIWDTFLKKAVLVNGATKAGVGVKAYCVARNGLGMETEYVSFKRPKATAVKMTKGPWLFTSFLGSWTFKDVSSNENRSDIFIFFRAPVSCQLIRYFYQA